MVNMFRNAVAHGEITYSKVVFKTPYLREIKAAAGIKHSTMKSQAGVFELIIAMRSVLPKKNYKRLIKDMDSLLKDYKDEFTSANYLALLQDMHIPENYEQIW